MSHFFPEGTQAWETLPHLVISPAFRGHSLLSPSWKGARRFDVAFA